MDNNNGLFGAMEQWVAHPFASTGSALNWVLFVGLLIVAVWFWQTVLLELRKDI